MRLNELPLRLLSLEEIVIATLELIVLSHCLVEQHLLPLEHLTILVLLALLQRCLGQTLRQGLLLGSDVSQELLNVGVPVRAFVDCGALRRAWRGVYVVDLAWESGPEVLDLRSASR